MVPEHELETLFTEICRVIAHHEENGDPVPDTLLMESAEIEMALEAKDADQTLPLAA